MRCYIIASVDAGFDFVNLDCIELSWLFQRPELEANRSIFPMSIYGTN